MRSLTEPATVVGFGQWEGRDGEPFTYRDGSAVEYVEVKLADEPMHRKLTLDRSLNGNERPATGEQVSLLIEDTMHADARVNRNGEPFVVYKDKRKVVGFQAAA